MNRGFCCLSRTLTQLSLQLRRPQRSCILSAYQTQLAEQCQVTCMSSRKFHSATSRFSSKSKSDPADHSGASDLLDDARSGHQEQQNQDSFPSDIAEETRTNSESWKRSQSKHRIHPRVNPKDTSILLFPGQGSQFVGMGRELLNYPNVEDMYAVASKILGYDLLDLCLNGPIEKLNQTVHCQPAILVTALAAVEKLKHVQPWAIEHCVTAAGFSIGEYAALVFAGCLSFEDAVSVVKVRAEQMQAASEATPSGMMTVFLSHRSKLRFACHTAKQYCSERMGIERPVCEVANYLYPECKVIAGHKEALDFIEQNAREFSLLRTRRLPVSGAFHTPLMAPAKPRLLDAIRDVDLTTPLVPIHANVNSYKYKNPHIMEKLLAEQIYRPVKWEQTMHVIYSREDGQDFPFTFEMGPGKQLGAILGKINKKAKARYQAIDV